MYNGRRNQYALRRGEDLLFVGTAREVAEYAGWPVDGVYYRASPSYRKRMDASDKPWVWVEKLSDTRHGVEVVNGMTAVLCGSRKAVIKATDKVTTCPFCGGCIKDMVV